MTLPPALAARLKKRGFLQNHNSTSQGQDEEVIAENYDKPVITDDLHDEFGQPMPPKWEKVFEPKFGTWYYWDTITNRVSWLPPSDPDARITYSENRNFSREDISAHATISSSAVAYKKVKERVKPVKRKKAPKEEEFDPMDPSSYADVPRGKWSMGLKRSDDAKTGVDSTANGPLFQQRPYPSPGEVLSRNKKFRHEAGPVKPK